MDRWRQHDKLRRLKENAAMESKPNKKKLIAAATFYIISLVMFIIYLINHKFAYILFGITFSIIGSVLMSNLKNKT